MDGWVAQTVTFVAGALFGAAVAVAIVKALTRAIRRTRDD